MKPWLPLLISIFSLLSLPSFSQDVHWTLFEYAPLNTNPAQTGAFYGTYRLSGIVRSQEFFGDQTQDGSSPYGPSMTFSIDGPIIRGFRKQDWVGIGGMFYQDASGEGPLVNNLSYLSVAYHLGLDKKQNTVLTFGLQGGAGSRRIKDWGGLRFQDEMGQNRPPGGGAGNMRDPDPEKGEGSIDINFGLLLKTKPNKTTNFEIGLVGKHLIPNRYGFYRGDTNASGDSVLAKLPINIGAHTGMDYQIDKKWSIRPAAQFQLISGGGAYFQLGAMWGYKLDPNKDMILKFGPGYRVGDAAQVLLGIEKGSLKAAMSYDVNLSGLSQFSRWGGGVEIAVSYIGTIFKQPDLKPVILCPRY